MASTWTCAEATFTGSSAPTARANHRRSDDPRSAARHPLDASSYSASSCRAAAERCCPESVRWWRDRPHKVTCPAHAPARCWTQAGRPRIVPPAGNGSRRCLTRSASAAWAGARSRRTRLACGSGWAGQRAARTPELLILDEPTNGLDPQGIHEVRDLLLRLHTAGTTIFLSSHLLAEVEQMCHRVGVLDRGRLVLQEDLATVQAPTGRVVVHTPDVDTAVALLDGRVGERAGGRLGVAPHQPAGV